MLEQGAQLSPLPVRFQQSKADPCVFFQWKDGNLNIVSIYVDDLILVVDLMKDLQKTKAQLSARFKMKDLGQLRYCLGIVCEMSEGQICINQRPYIDKDSVCRKCVEFQLRQMPV